MVLLGPGGLPRAGALHPTLPSRGSKQELCPGAQQGWACRCLQLLLSARLLASSKTAVCSSLQEAWLLTRERELKEEIRKGRDQEIELVIHRLEADMTLAKEESERAAESR